MPISALTGFTGTASLTTLRTNIALIEAYIKGEIDPADFQDKLKTFHGQSGSTMRLYGDHWSSGAQAIQKASVSDPATDTWELDRDALLDFSCYGDIDADTYDGGNLLYSIKEWDLVRRFTWEKLGNIPTANSNGTGARLETSPSSWHNWLFNAPDPLTDIAGLSGTGTYFDGREYTGRFAKDEYWDRWLTVPYACKRIWIPEQCVLLVMASARGTWNHNLNPAMEHDTEALSGVAGHAWGSGYDQTIENPAFFRLFIDRDNDREWRKFSWEVNEDTFYANWSPIQHYPQVGYGGPGESGVVGKQQGIEWSFTCAPRGTAMVASQIVVPEAGWYNISLRYNSRYWHGYTEDVGGGVYNWFPTFLKKAGTNGYRPGPITQARWESSGIGGIAFLGRTTITDDALNRDFS